MEKQKTLKIYLKFVKLPFSKCLFLVVYYLLLDFHTTQQVSHYCDEESKVQRGWVIFPKLHSW